MDHKKKLSDSQEKRMKKHSKHHSSKHMKMMRSKMMQGMSFSEAHKMAQKKEGK